MQTTEPGASERQETRSFTKPASNFYYGSMAIA